MKKIILFFLFITAVSGTLLSQPYPFTAIDTNFNTPFLLLPSGFQYSILFQQNQPVLLNNGTTRPARGSNDFLIFIPNNGSSTNGWIFVNHETTDSNTFLGDGGGATTFPVQRVGNSWFPTGPFKHMDFSHLGGTLSNC